MWRISSVLLPGFTYTKTRAIILLRVDNLWAATIAKIETRLLRQVLALGGQTCWFGDWREWDGFVLHSGTCQPGLR